MMYGALKNLITAICLCSQRMISKMSKLACPSLRFIWLVCSQSCEQHAQLCVQTCEMYVWVTSSADVAFPLSHRLALYLCR